MADDDMARLKAPPGTDEANYNEMRFHVDDSGCIKVPREIAPAFEQGAAGFVEADPAPPPLPDGVLTVRARPGTSANFAGVIYSVSAEGLVEIPARAWPTLASHGFRIAH